MTRRRWPGPGSLRIASSSAHRGLVEEVEELVVFLLGDRVKLVIVAAGRNSGSPQPDGSHGFGHVHDVIDSVFFRDASTFSVDHVIAAEACCQDAFFRALR